MPTYVYAIVNAAFAVLVVGGVAGLLYWAIVTQHRDPGCAEVRLRRPRPSTPPMPPIAAARPTRSPQPLLPALGPDDLAPAANEIALT